MKKSWNRILDNTDREKYTEPIARMFKVLPEMMNRKIGTANVQQAFTIEAVTEFSDEDSNILCVGSFEDSSCEYLIKEGKKITAIDPVLNMDLHEYAANRDKGSFNIVFSCSVIEHTTDDMEFMQDIIDMLALGGVAVLTCDFKNDWVVGQRVPYTSNRFYTESDLLGRFKNLLEANDCHYVGTPQWNNQKYEFAWEGIPYDFATIVFKKGI